MCVIKLLTYSGITARSISVCRSDSFLQRIPDLLLRGQGRENTAGLASLLPVLPTLHLPMSLPAYLLPVEPLPLLATLRDLRGGCAEGAVRDQEGARGGFAEQVLFEAQRLQILMISCRLIVASTFCSFAQ